MRQTAWWDGTPWTLWCRWGALILWMLVMSGFSTDQFSAAETGRFLLPLLRWLAPGASPADLDLLHVMVRKSMHVIEFAILALLWYRALDWPRSAWRTRTALASLFLAVGFGLVDEAHQIFVPSRSASIGDVGWDGLGSVLGVGIRHVARW